MANYPQIGRGHSLFSPPRYVERSIAIAVSVCLCVCLSAIISSQLHVRSSPNFFAPVTRGYGSVLVCRRSDMLCTSGFMDDVVFAHKPRLLDVAAQLKRSAHAAWGLAKTSRRNTRHRQRTHGATSRGRIRWQQRGRFRL